MQMFIKTLTGKTIIVQVNANDTWRDIKRQIYAKEGIPTEAQRIIIAGRVADENLRLDFHEISYLECIHLVVRWETAFNTDSHKLYAVVHNFYEAIDGAQLQALQYAIPITGHETPDALEEIFAQIYEVRATRIRKNATHVQNVNRDGNQAPKANPVVALVAVKHGNLQVLDNGDRTQTIISQYDNQPLNLQLLSYMLEDGTSIFGQMQHHPDQKIHDINQAFRLFCAQKRRQDPHYFQQLQDQVRNEYGEIKSYIEMTTDYLFEDRPLEEKRAIIQGVRNLCRGIRPNEAAPLYTEITQLDVIELAERFRVVRSKLEGKFGEERNAILQECKNVIKLLLDSKLNEFEAALTPPAANARTPTLPEAANNPPTNNAELIQEAKKEYQIVLDKLEHEVVGFEDKAKKNKNYTVIANASRILYRDLTDQYNKFFESPNREKFTTFKQQSQHLLTQAYDKFNTHRGWHKIHPIIRGLLGVLAAMTLIPALLVSLKTSKGYLKTFFATPETKSAQKLLKLTSDFDTEFDNLKAQFTV